MRDPIYFALYQAIFPATIVNSNPGRLQSFVAFGTEPFHDRHEQDRGVRGARFRDSDCPGSQLSEENGWVEVEVFIAGVLYRAGYEVLVSKRRNQERIHSFNLSPQSHSLQVITILTTM